MRIGVVSDTHSKCLPKSMMDDFRKVDLIIHAGDFCSLDILKKFESIAHVQGVHGNMDDPALRGVLPKKRIIECEGLRLGVFHGEGAPSSLLTRIKMEFKDDQVQAIIFGHSHQPLNQHINETLFFNPGSPTDKIFAPYQSYGILDVYKKTISGTIIQIL